MSLWDSLKRSHASLGRQAAGAAGAAGSSAAAASEHLSNPLSLCTSVGAMVFFLHLHDIYQLQSRQASWQAGPSGGYDDDVQQALSDSSVDAAPSLSHPQKDLMVTAVAGGVSGAVAKTAIAPLARLTILYQVQALQSAGNKAPGLLAAVQQVIRQEGWRSLWKGNLATILHRVPYSATNFAVFEYVKQALDTRMDSDVGRRLAAGAASGLVACTAAYPLDLVRTRLAAQRDLLPQASRLTMEAGQALGLSPRAGKTTPLNYRGTRHAFKCIVREEGLMGMYRGLGATLLQVTPTLALNFAFYDTFKAWYLQRSGAVSSGTSPMPTPNSRSSCATSSQSSPAASSWHAQGQSGLPSRPSDRALAGTSPQPFPTPLGTAEQDTPSSSSSSSAPPSQPAGQQPHDPAHPAHRLDAPRQPSGSEQQAAVAQAPRPQLDVVGSLGCAAAAGFFTSTLTFPLDVVRKRLQTDRGTHTRMSFAEACARVWRQQGVRGFYAGIVPEYCKVLPGMAIAFTVYEGIKQAGGVKST